MGIRDIIKKAERFDLAAMRERLQSPEIIQRTKAVRHPTLADLGFAIFEVQSDATGDGVYNCYEQILDKTEWDDTAGDPKFDDLNTTSIEVLNLAEFNPEATYVRHLTAGDLIAAWRVGDDEDNPRWAGVPFKQGAHGAGLRNAYCKTDAGNGSTIVCYLDVDGTGTEITVNCDISNGSNLNAAARRLKNGNRLAVYKVGSTWYSAEGFDTDEECVCDPPP